ncbi:hypothetical protein D3C73_892740 [compost metagenome]
MAAEPAQPGRAGGRGRRQDQLACGIGLTSLFGNRERVEHRYTGLAIDGDAVGDGAMQPRRLVIHRAQLGKHALRLAQRVAEQHGRFATLRTLATPGGDLGRHRAGIRPAIDRQRECGFSDEGIAGHHFERCAGGIGLTLVVARRDPDLLTVVDAHLR